MKIRRKKVRSKYSYKPPKNRFAERDETIKRLLENKSKAEPFLHNLLIESSAECLITQRAVNSFREGLLNLKSQKKKNELYKLIVDYFTTEENRKKRIIGRYPFDIVELVIAQVTRKKEGKRRLGIWKCTM